MKYVHVLIGRSATQRSVGIRLLQLFATLQLVDDPTEKTAVIISIGVSTWSVSLEFTKWNISLRKN